MTDTVEKLRPTATSRSPHDRRFGIGIAAATAVVSGIAVAINGYGVRAWADNGGSATYTTAKNLVAAFVLVAVLAMVTARKSKEGFTKPSSRSQWAGLAAIAIVGGSVPFLLFFEGLSRATSTNAAFIHKSLIVFVALLAVPLLGEKLRVWHYGAIAVLLWGQAALAGGVAGLVAGTGEMMILAATILWSIEVVIAKKLLVGLSPLTLAGARMGVGSIVLIGYGIFSGAFSALGAVGIGEMGWVVLTGGVLSLFVLGWYSALARAQAVDVMAVLVGGALITSLIQTGFQGAVLPALGVGLIAAGVVIVIVGSLRQSNRPTAAR